MQNDIRTKAIVLRRTNYGESDRILNLLTENGLISCIAKGVRKEKSKLAGGIEMFCLSEVTVHSGKNNKLGILTSAKMLEAYQNITLKLDDLELASLVLKKVEKAAIFFAASRGCGVIPSPRPDRTAGSLLHAEDAPLLTPGRHSPAPPLESVNSGRRSEARFPERKRRTVRNRRNRTPLWDFSSPASYSYLRYRFSARWRKP